LTETPILFSQFFKNVRGPRAGGQRRTAPGSGGGNADNSNGSNSGGTIENRRPFFSDLKKGGSIRNI